MEFQETMKQYNLRGEMWVGGGVTVNWKFHTEENYLSEMKVK